MVSASDASTVAVGAARAPSHRAVGRQQPSTSKDSVGVTSRDAQPVEQHMAQAWGLPPSGAPLRLLSPSHHALCVPATDRLPFLQLSRKTVQFRSRKWPQCPVLPGAVDSSSCCSWRRGTGQSSHVLLETVPTAGHSQPLHPFPCTTSLALATFLSLPRRQAHASCSAVA